MKKLLYISGIKSILLLSLISVIMLVFSPQKALAIQCDTSMTDPTGQDFMGGQWANVNKWNSQIATAINFIANYSDTAGTCVPGNFVKSFMMEESQGIELEPNSSWYMGLMQVSDDRGEGGGSNCDWPNKPTFDVETTTGNLNCGIQHIARGYKTCQSWEGTVAQYFSGGCAITDNGDGNETVRQYVKNVMDRWNSMGGAPPGSTTGGTSAGNFNSTTSLTLKLLPLPAANDSYIKNEVIAQVFGAKNGTGSSSASTGTGLPGQPLPSGGIAEISNQLCTTYDVCPTENLFDPGGEWTLPQITGLWNVVQKIYASPIYRKYAIGSNTIEVTKTSCLPGGCSGYWGYYAGLADEFSDFHNLSGSRLVIMSSETPNDGPVGLIEWLLAHEIGHGASGGTPEGGLDNCGLACNPPSLKMIACGTPVSTYSTNEQGEIVVQEYVAEAISYYMTNAEEVRDNYKGTAGGSMKTDFPCLYNATKELFGGVEYE